VRQIALKDIQPSPRNPRLKVAGIEAMAESIREYGLLQPILLRETSAGYEVVAGHRRLSAVQSLGWTKIPALVRAAAADEAYLLTLIENLQRDDLSPREQSRALETLVRERGWSTRQVAAAVKRSPAYVSKRLRVFDDPVLAELVIANRLTVSAAEELLPLPDAQKRALARRAVDEGWEPHQVRAAAAGRAKGMRPSQRAGLASTTRELRQMIRDARAQDLNETERRELRLLFQDLALLAKAPRQRQDMIFPPLRPIARSQRA
jgi:ParB family transcriptional regulator, chromosome partitioning protein